MIEETPPELTAGKMRRLGRQSIDRSHLIALLLQATEGGPFSMVELAEPGEAPGQFVIPREKSETGPGAIIAVLNASESSGLNYEEAALYARLIMIFLNVTKADTLVPELIEKAAKFEERRQEPKP